MDSPTGTRQGVHVVSFRDVAALHGAYMPFFKHGGLFVTTAQICALGDEVVLLVELLDEKPYLSVAGRVAWITPDGAQGNRATGVGVHFHDTADGRLARERIERLLAGLLSAERPTQTM